MGGVTFDKLYDNYNTLSDAKEKIAEHSREYLEAIESTKGEEKEKKLATQIITKFFKQFPSLQDKAVEAIFDVCEDEDATIRIAAMKALPSICKDNKNYTPKVSDILAQLLQVEDPQEYNIACSSIMQIMKIDPKVVIKNLFKQANEPDSYARDKCLKFLVTKVKGLERSIITPDVEDVIITEIKNSLHAVLAHEYVDLIGFLKSTRLSQSFTGQQELVEIAAEKAELDKDFDPLDQETNQVDRLLTCIKLVIPYFSSKVDSTKFVMYICDKVLPKWNEIGTLQQGELLQLAILRQLAELSAHCGQLDNPSLYVVQIYQKLKDYMPPPPEDTANLTMPVLDFTIVECLLYAFHKLARQCPDFLTHDPQVLKEFRSRLTYFSRGAQGCTKALSNLDIRDRALSEEDKKKKNVAPKLLNNINTLIRDLFYQPPKYQCTVKLSFKIEEVAVKKVQEKSPPSGKRHVPITFETNGSTFNKQSRTNKSSDGVQLYTPPSGKFSNSFQNFNGRNRGGRIARGGGRGRSSNRSWRK
ncbi:hypothetical protein RN001_002843 [Aquatica leii]|uniref:Apoptosis inhibitor 5 n=1 Tax=Aquatica leii TaxID=1421715 RepID=A0AAN7PHG0_9COLE|nr:hypothetical protein RN001_002843 [Aquatica leii]